MGSRYGAGSFEWSHNEEMTLYYAESLGFKAVVARDDEFDAWTYLAKNAITNRVLASGMARTEGEAIRNTERHIRLHVLGVDPYAY